MPTGWKLCAQAMLTISAACSSGKVDLRGVCPTPCQSDQICDPNTVTCVCKIKPCSTVGSVCDPAASGKIGLCTQNAASGCFSVTSLSACPGGESCAAGDICCRTPGSTLQITTGSLAAGTAGTAYMQQLVATGGATPYTWSINGTLPLGLTMANGIISGTPTASGTTTFTVTVTDASGAGATVSLSITIGAGGSSGGPNSLYGLNVDFNEQSFVDLIQALSNFVPISGSGTVASDAQGWPTQDFQFYIDNRYTFGWLSNPPNIDPLKFSTDLSGAYTLTFRGQATVSGWGGATVSNSSYDAGSNTTTATVTLASVATGIFCGLNFTATKRLAGDAPGDGLTDVHLLRPGYAAGTTEIFTSLWTHSVKDFGWSTLRFMGAMGTNSYGEAYPTLLQWATDRALPGFGPLYQTTHIGVHGPPWEYVVQAGNLTGKDVWINVPVNASDAYVTALAQLFHDGDAATANAGLAASLNIVLEYSNEMWHLGFPQGPWNQSAAQAEVAAGGSSLNYDGINDLNMQRLRRIAKRTIEIGQLFKTVFSDNPGRIRPVINCAWEGFYADMLDYVTRNYGPPANYLYGIAQTGYYTSADWSSVTAILNGEKANSDQNAGSYVQGRAIATFYGLHSLVYEGGEGETGNPTAASPADPNLANKFAAARDPGMEQVTTYDLLTNWYPSGGELYMQFSHVGRYSVYGFWGLSEDLTNLSTGKWLGVQDVLATAPPAVTAGTVLPASVGDTTSIPETAPAGTNWWVPSDQPWLELLVSVSASGTYGFKLQGLQTGTSQLQFCIDNVKVSSVSLPTSGSGPDPYSSEITAALMPGLHAIFVYGPQGSGPSGVHTQAGDAIAVRRIS
jgi:hypothetical protein